MSFAVDLQATHLAPKIMDTIDTHPAKYLFVIEARWFTPWPMQVWTKKMTKKVLHANIGLHHMEPLLLDALKTMLDHLRNNGAQHVFLSTSTPYVAVAASHHLHRTQGTGKSRAGRPNVGCRCTGRPTGCSCCGSVVASTCCPSATTTRSATACTTLGPGLSLHIL